MGSPSPLNDSRLHPARKDSVEEAVCSPCNTKNPAPQRNGVLTDFFLADFSDTY